MKAEIVGKPAAKFFLAAIEDMNIAPEDVSNNYFVSIHILNYRVTVNALCSMLHQSFGALSLKKSACRCGTVTSFKAKLETFALIPI